MKDDFICQTRLKISKMEKKREKKGKKPKKSVWSYCMKKTLEYVEAFRTQQAGALLG